MPATLQTMRSGGAQHPEEIVNFLASKLVAISGVFRKDIADSFKVQQETVPAMSVKVGQGNAFITKSDLSMAYPVRLSGADASAVIGANSSGNSRIDAVVLYIDLSASANSDISNVAKLAVIAGTPAGSPVAPSDATIQSSLGASNPFIRLANVTVASGASSIVTANISDQRTEASFFNSNMDGWRPIMDTVTRNSIDAPTVVLKITGKDYTNIIGVGMRFKGTQSGSIFYGIVTVCALSGSDTLITIYCGTDYTVTDTAVNAITLPFFSSEKAPKGFPLDPTKWTVKVTDTSDRSVAVASNTWTQVNAADVINIPIGLWDVDYQVSGHADRTSAGTGDSAAMTLSTSTNSVSDDELTCMNGYYGSGVAGSSDLTGGAAYRRKIISLAAKATYYLLVHMQNAGTYYIQPSQAYSGTVVLRAVCAYL